MKKLLTILIVAACTLSVAAFVACGGEEDQTGETVTYVGKTYGVNVEDVKYYTYYSDGSKSEAWDESIADYDSFVELMTELDLKLTFTDETGAYLSVSGGVVTIVSSYTLSDGVFVFTDCVSSYENSSHSAEEYMNSLISFSWNGTTVTFKLCGDEDQSAGEKYYAEGDMYEITE